LRIFKVPLVTFTYFVVGTNVVGPAVFCAVAELFPVLLGFAADKKLVLIYPSFPFAFTFAQPFASE
jgi:hypothetical protein